MTSEYLFLTSKGIECKPVKLVEAIGIDNYKKWRNLERIFKVCDSLTAADFAVYAYSKFFYPTDLDNSRMLGKIHYMLSDLMKNIGIDNMYMGTIYAINRGLEVQLISSNFIATHMQEKFSEQGICGSGQSAILAIADLHRELTNEKLQTFIP